MELKPMLHFKLLHPRGREQSLDKRLTRPLREPEIRSRLWRWVLLVGMLFLASVAFGRQPLPQDSQLFQNFHVTATEMGA